MSTPQETQQAIDQQLHHQQQLQQQQDEQHQSLVSSPSQQQQQQHLSQVIATASAAVSNGIGENLHCQWQGCGERCQSAETLYDHICERHVGRKSTNNLNLTCQWGNCRTTTVKRDHITSHIRVHVPLKPHKCEFCGKPFKRPQDLKKHVKTHADDSVILRSPEPGQPRPSGNMYVPNEKGPSTYYSAINPNGGYDGHHPGTNQYYQPQHGHQGSQPPYGNVYYTAAPTQQAALNDFEARKRGLDALDQFFGEVKARRLDDLTYQNISQRLYELQGLQLPLITQHPVSAVPAYQPAVAAAGGDGGYDNGGPVQAYSLPPMNNAKSRGDLTSIDQILEQMQATIYENDSDLARAGVGQPGAHYVDNRPSDSPTSAPVPSPHPQPTQVGPQQPQQQQKQQQEHHHNASIASTADSISSSTPALTPPSSSQSFTSGRSPVANNFTPLQAPNGNSASSGSAMYPSLPGIAMDTGYSNNASVSNPATLSGLYDGEDHRRRWSGGTLQRAQPAPRRGSGDAVEVGSDGAATPPAASHNAKVSAAASKRRGQGSTAAASAANHNVIDPALSSLGSTDDVTVAAAAAASAALKSPASTNGGEMSERDMEKEYAWVNNMRLIEWMRDYVRKKLGQGDFEDDAGQNTASVAEPKDVEMGDGGGSGDVEVDVDVDGARTKEDLYPSLKRDKA